MNRNDDESPDFSSGFKILAAAVFVGLIVIAAGSPINWAPTTVPDVAAAKSAPAAAEGFSAQYEFDVREPTPHVEAF